MKLIHLSDLHLGKRVNEFSMMEDQEYILEEILKITLEERPEGVIIAGDVYDLSLIHISGGRSICLRNGSCTACSCGHSQNRRYPGLFPDFACVG